MDTIQEVFDILGEEEFTKIWWEAIRETLRVEEQTYEMESFFL